MFPFSHVPSRFLNIMSLAESSPQIRDESARGLRPFSLETEGLMVKQDSSVPWPRFTGVVLLPSDFALVYVNNIRAYEFLRSKEKL